MQTTAGGSAASSRYITYSDDPLGVLSLHGFSLVPELALLLATVHPPCAPHRLSRRGEPSVDPHARLVPPTGRGPRDPKLHAVADRAAQHDPRRVRVGAARRERGVVAAIRTRAGR